MLNVTARNTMADAFGALAAYRSLHSGYPSTTGANEISGGSPAYARKPITWNASSSGNLDDSNTATFDIPPSTTVYYQSYWSASSGGTNYGFSPLGSTGYNSIYVDTSTDTVYAPGHGFANGDRVVFINSAPAGLTEGTIYFVINTATDSFKVSTTSGGSAVDITGQATSTMRVSKVVPESYNGQGTYQVTDTDIVLV